MKTIIHLGTVITFLVVIGILMNSDEFIDDFKCSEEENFFSLLAVTEGLTSYLENEGEGYT